MSSKFRFVYITKYSKQSHIVNNYVPFYNEIILVMLVTETHNVDYKENISCSMFVMGLSK